MNNTESYEALKLNNQVCFPLYACSKELVNRYTPYLKRLGLTYTQYIVMMVLWEKESVSSRELADCLHLDYGTLTPVLKRLENSEYLTRQRDPKDERLLLISLTEKGNALKDEAVGIPTCIAKCMGLTEEEFKTLYVLTYKALANMEKTKNGLD
ncbi:MAG: MarR family transcriptional regulator [Lachnospiraceae bacterium]|nr:MarR family transcriptional regulator [Lachnospiraceae bacterium]